MIHWRNSASLAITAAALAAAGCAHAPPASSLLADEPMASNARCSAARQPERLPPPEELVDAGFRAEAGRLWAQAGRPAGHVLFSIRHDPEGVQVRRAVIESTVPDALADSLQALVFAHRKQAAAARSEWGVRLRVDLGDPVTLAVGRRLECAPRPREEDRLAHDAFDIRERGLSTAALPSTDASLVWVRVRLDARGRVTDAAVERGIQRGMWEQRLLNYVRTMAFYPAVEDGFPVPGELTFRLRALNQL
jgi:hypothetical protein